MIKSGIAGLAMAACVAAAFPASAATVGSATRATGRGCAAVTAAQACDGTGPGQFVFANAWGGGVGVGGLTRVDAGLGNFAWSNVRFDGSLELPEIKAYTQAAGNVRMNINTFAFQSYVWTGETAGAFSITGDLHVVDSSTSPSGGAGPGGAIFTSYVGIWDPSILAGLTTPQQLFSSLFYQDCGPAGVLGVGSNSGVLTGGSFSAAATTTACSAGSLTLTPGQEVLVVVGMQLPVNRGGFVDSSSTFVTRLGDDLTPEQLAVAQSSLSSAIERGAAVAGVPEPSSWAMLIAGFGLVGAAMRRRAPVQAKL